jgi:acetyltransferase-like isoleucine patch superfamily enzyme
MSTHKIYPNVIIGEGAVIGDYVIIGEPPGNHQPGELKTVIGKNAVIRSHTVIYAGNIIGDNLQTGHGVMIRENNVIGDDFKIWSQANVYHHICIGNNVTIHMGAGISEFSTLEDDAWIGPRVVTTSVLHPGCPKAKECWKGPIIRQGAVIGGNAVILPDLEVGKKAFVSAGAVVTKSVPDHKIVFGNPARIVGDTYTSLSCPYELIDKPYQEPEVGLTQTTVLQDFRHQKEKLSRRK